jgi:hypothetical protein
MTTETKTIKPTQDVIENLRLCRDQQIRLLGVEKFLINFDQYVPLIEETKKHHKCELLDTLHPLGELCAHQDDSGFLFSLLNAVIAEMAEPTVSNRI